MRKYPILTRPEDVNADGRPAGVSFKSYRMKEVRDVPILTIGIDTDPYQNPRSYQYNEPGMPLEGWKQSGNPIFGCSWFVKEFLTQEEAEKVKAEMKAKLEALYQDDHIRGAQFRIS